MGEEALAAISRVFHQEGFRQAEEAAGVLSQLVPPWSDGKPYAMMSAIENPKRRAAMVRNLQLWADRPQFPVTVSSALKVLRRLRGHDESPSSGNEEGNGLPS
jgi:hypothetical protein